MSTLLLKGHVDVQTALLYTYICMSLLIGWCFGGLVLYVLSCHVKHPHGIIVFGPPSGLPITAANAAF